MKGLRTRLFRIRIVLTLIALIPLAGLTWVAVDDVVAARAERARVAEIQESVGDLIILTEARILVLEERNWTAVAEGVDMLGVTPGFVSSLTGFDIPETRAELAADVDWRLAELGLDDVRAELDQVRAGLEENRSDPDRSFGEADAGYIEVGESLEQLSAERMTWLTQATGEVTDRGDLASSLKVFSAATVARQAVAAELGHLIKAQFSEVADQHEEIRALVTSNTARASATADIESLASADSQIHELLDDLAASEKVLAFDLSVAALIDDTVDGAVADPSLGRAVVRFNDVVSSLDESRAAADIYAELVDAAGQDVVRAGAETSASAAERDRRALMVLFGVGMLSIAAAWSATRAIVQPIHALARSARQIRDGEGDDEDLEGVALRGPVEVREAAEAINEARTHLKLAERQALALAQGALDHPCLDESSTGALGASLQRAVRTLAESMQEREEFRRRVAYEASHDGLTELPNRTASLAQLRRGLGRARQSNLCLAVLFVDLDGFKEINDELGHHAGDAVLRTTAHRLAAAIREGDHVGRLGGDEFVVVAEPVADEYEAEIIAQRVLASIAEPIRVDNSTVIVGASIGIALSGPEHDTIEDLLRDADLAVYRAKELGRSQIAVCNEELKAAVAERADFDRALRQALTADEFILHYQPMVEPVSHTLIGFEALVRWDRPGHGLIPPDTFISFAEGSDLIMGIDKWVLNRAALQLKEWQDVGAFPEMSVSINISARHLASPDFIANVLEPMERYGIDESRVVIEITESALFDDLSMAASKLQYLRNRGFRTAIDDFGTGYTSFAHLRGLPIDTLKIDKSFVDDPSATQLVQVIIDTGHLLGAKVTAEGIETFEQAESLRDMGTDVLQGYLFGPPLPVAKLEQLRSRQPLPLTS